MKRPGRCRPTTIVAVLLMLAAIPAAAQVRTHVNLAGKDDSLPKLGLPGIRVEVEAGEVGQADAVAKALRGDLRTLTYSRPLVADEPGDYRLRVRLGASTRSATTTFLPFEAQLAEPDGTPLWRIDGRTEADGVPLDAAALQQLCRNVISALVHDGWLQAKQDPKNPPPPPPMVRRDTPR